MVSCPSGACAPVTALYFDVQYIAGVSMANMSGLAERPCKGIFFLLILLAFVSLIQCGKEKYPEWKEAHSGIPDADKFRPYLDGEEIDFY